MENLINVKCSDTTYLCNTRPNSNFYKEENLLIGAINNNFQNYNIFKSLLRFYISDTSLDSLENVYLYLFLENAYHTNNNASISISLSGDDENFDISKINWQTCPKKNTQTQINISVPIKSNKKYIKIDISNIIKTLNSYTNLYNIIIEPLNYNSSSMLQFGSNNSDNAPYLVLVSNTASYTDSINDYDSIDNNNNNNNDDGDITDNENTEENEISKTPPVSNKDKFDIDYLSAEIINELNTQNSKFDTLEENLSKLINSFASVITASKNNSANLDNKLDTKLLPTLSKFNENFSTINNNTNLLKNYIEKLSSQKNTALESLNNLTASSNELLKTEISKLNSSLNSTISELQSNINTNISNLSNSIENINSHLNANSNLFKDSIEKLIDQKNSAANPLVDLIPDSKELIESAIYQLKNSVNNDITELKSYTTNNINDLANSIKTINETLLQLSSQISKMSATFESVIISPLGDESL